MLQLGLKHIINTLSSKSARKYLFFSFRNPNTGDYVSPVVWEPFNPVQPQYFDINEKPTMKSNFFTKRYNIWDGLFPIDIKCK